MSDWVSINGIVLLYLQVRTQHENDYILNTVLVHLPIVSGSEGGMKPYIVRNRDKNILSPFDERGVKK